MLVRRGPHKRKINLNLLAKQLRTIRAGNRATGLLKRSILDQRVTLRPISVPFLSNREKKRTLT